MTKISTPKIPDTILSSWLSAVLPPLWLVAASWILGADAVRTESPQGQVRPTILSANPWIGQAAEAISKQSAWVLPLVLANLAALYAFVFVLRDSDPKLRKRVESWGFRLAQVVSFWAGIAIFAGFSDGSDTRAASVASAFVIAGVCLILSIFAADLSYFNIGLTQRRDQIEKYLEFLAIQVIPTRRRPILHGLCDRGDLDLLSSLAFYYRVSGSGWFGRI
ncbi:MAG: hypothetical protein QM655_15370 [Nocardioidaceae bacterium]